MRLMACFFYLIMLGFHPLTLWAGVNPISMLGDARLVVFNYDPNIAYTIYALPGAVTDVELAPGERVQALAMGDTVQWMVDEAENHVFIKPIRGGIFTSATLVTSKQTYQLILRSVSSGKTWFQRVSWQNPKMVLFQSKVIPGNAQAGHPAGRMAQLARKRQVLVSGLDPSSLNFDYRIKGKADFRPRQVFDNGIFTWILLEPHLQEMPALFEIGNGGKTSLLNYTVEGNYIKISRLMPKMLLKLGRTEVSIINLHLYHPPSLFNWFRGQGWGRSW